MQHWTGLQNEYENSSALFISVVWRSKDSLHSTSHWGLVLQFKRVMYKTLIILDAYMTRSFLTKHKRSKCVKNFKVNVCQNKSVKVLRILTTYFGRQQLIWFTKKYFYEKIYLTSELFKHNVVYINVYSSCFHLIEYVVSFNLAELFPKNS